AAQQPSMAQVSAIRQACRSDYQRYCSSVPTGGSAALACLQRNVANLSASCSQAVAGVGGPAAPTSTPAQPAEMPAAASPSSQKAGLPAPETWPPTIAANGASVVVYPPQAISWPGQTLLKARTALAITRKGAAKPILGTVEVAAQ